MTSTATSPISVYQAGLRSPEGRLWLLREDGTATRLPVGAWRGELDAADLELVRRCAGPTLDVGCGPGRLVAALSARRVPALGLDVAPAAVVMTRRRGGAALLGDVFEWVPATGRWHRILLADGNIGIGGDPIRLLRRTRDLLAPAGRLLVEVGANGDACGSARVRLATADGAVSDWFGWGHLTVGGVAEASASAGLEVEQIWVRGARYFAALRRCPLDGRRIRHARQATSAAAENQTHPSTIARLRP